VKRLLLACASFFFAITVCAAPDEDQAGDYSTRFPRFKSVGSLPAKAIEFSSTVAPGS